MPEVQTQSKTLQPVDVGPKSFARYLDVIGEDRFDELKAAASPLRGARVAHVNATTYGGGVSELLRSAIPLYRGLGLDADWLVIPGSPEFFDVTKGIHNALQGAPYRLTDKRKDLYLEQNRRAAEALGRQYDFVVVHDPQPAAMRAIHGANNARWVWRCHIDTSEPNQGVLDFLRPYLADYDALVFTMDQFVPKGLHNHSVAVIPPGIDPLSPKNMPVPGNLCRQMLEWAGVRLDQPLITQISRFDPWKDPLGVIRAYNLVREEVPGAQLALLGQMALDDPEGWEMYRDIVKEVGPDPDIHVLTNFTGIGNMEVNAFQAASDVVLQKSIREGFGLVVSETLWKGTPVVAGRAGGIPLQMPEGVGGYLIETIEECAQRTIELLCDPRLADELGASGRAHIRERFLVTRLVRDELQLLASIR